VKVDRYGIPDPDDFRKIIKKNGKPSLISIMYVNNETGVILPLKEIVKIAKEYDVLVHSDIVQAVGKIEINLRELGVDFATFSAHKIYGPKGAGVLYVKKGTPLDPLLHGGKQEDGLRAGTQNVTGAVGLAKALELCTKELKKETRRLRKIQQLFESLVLEIEDTKINGHPEFRVPTTSNILFKGVEGETLLISLDLEGIAVSMGSACLAESKTPSHVLIAMGLTEEEAKSSIRFSFGIYTQEEDIYYTAEKLKEIIKKLRE
jgi:Cysteine sulfinate desulfinase/cysteine desulfurase and related enzymes